ncbi:TPA: hypothetical protein ACTYZB_004862 [Klebsiella variicola]
MSLKLYLKICSLIAASCLVVGLIAPYLISQKSDLDVILGFLLLIATPFVACKAAINLITQLLKGNAK